MGQNQRDVELALKELHRQEFKTLVKEAIKEWLDDQAAVVGKWSFRFILGTALAALTYFILTSQGWHK